MTRRLRPPALVAIGALTALTAVTAAASGAGEPGQRGDAEPRLVGRAILPADATAPAPFPGIPDTDPAPAPGSRQPVGGFSALIPATNNPDRERGQDQTLWAMPDNGFGSKANSRSFLLRVYRVALDLETRRGGSGEVRILDHITLRDPDRRIPFEIVTEASTDRLLTGGDFDIESMRVDARGDLWFGEEFGPFLLHTDATGKVLEAPIPLPDVKSPDYPAGFAAPVDGAANLGRSNGFEGMAISPDGTRLYPTLEGPVDGDEATHRRVYEFDLRTGEYTDRRWTYPVAEPGFLVADLTALGRNRVIALERDNGQGSAARHKQAFVIDLRDAESGQPLPKRPVVDLLDIADPAGISEPARPGDIGIGDPFAMPYQTIESVLPLPGSRLAIVNDTNFGSTGRNPDLPDYSDFIIVQVPGLRG